MALSKDFKKKIWKGIDSLSILYSPTDLAPFFYIMSPYLGVMLLASGNLTIKKNSVFALAYTIIN